VTAAYDDVIIALGNLARTLESCGSDNYAEAARKDCDEMSARKLRNLLKLAAAVAANTNGGRR
jgi:hypothetical protein